jgi:hypothetical protein
MSARALKNAFLKVMQNSLSACITALQMIEAWDIKTRREE